MATRVDIRKDMRDTIGNSPCVADIERYLGVGKGGAKAFLEGLPSYEVDGRARRYLTIDLARRLDERQVGGF